MVYCTYVPTKNNSDNSLFTIAKYKYNATH